MTYLYFLYICIINRNYNMTSKYLHKWTLLLLKSIPMILALTALLNTLLSYYDIDVPLLSYLGGISLFPLIFLYLASYAFQFCEYHRMFLHYVTINWILNIVDYYWGIPISNKGLFILYIAITGISLFIILYLYLKSRKRK